MTALLSLQQLQHHYPGAAPTLDSVSFEVSSGEIVAVLGPSGCGKSTLLRILAGLEPYSGQIVRHGEVKTAYHPQTDELFSWRTVIENAALAADIAGHDRGQTRRRAADLLDEFGLAGFGDHYPDQLSGGMRQRAALLRTVLSDRQVFLLDEPFSSLDAELRADLNRWLGQTARRHGWTILLVTHDVNEARQLADRVITLSARPGRVLNDEPTGD
jgi:ABC-type nitrate/sulfonate/bicarbonate transport system ATPase subunit